MTLVRLIARFVDVGTLKAGLGTIGQQAEATENIVSTKNNCSIDFKRTPETRTPPADAAAAAAAEGAAGGGGAGGGGDGDTNMKAFELFKLSHNIKKMLGEERRTRSNWGLLFWFPSGELLAQASSLFHGSNGVFDFDPRPPSP